MFKDERTTDEILRAYLKRKENKRRAKGLLISAGILFGMFMLAGPSDDADEKDGDKKVEVNAEANEGRRETAAERKERIQLAGSVVVPHGNYTDPEIQVALNSGENLLRDTIEDTDKFIDELISDQLKIRREKNLTIRQFREVITPETINKIKRQIQELNKAAEISSQMAIGRMLVENGTEQYYGIERIDAQKMLMLSNNMNSIAYSLETYMIANNFEDWKEASSYLPNRKVKALYAVKLSNAIKPTGEESAQEVESVQAYAEAMAIFEQLSNAKKSMRESAQSLEGEVAVSGNSITYPVSVKSLEPLEMGMDTFSNSLLSIQHVDYPDYLSADITLVGQKFQELKVATDHLHALYGEDNKITLTSKEEAEELQAAFRTIADILNFTMTNSQRMFREFEDNAESISN